MKRIWWLLVLMPTLSFAGTSSKLTLGAPPLGFIARDAKNGQWRGGYLKSVAELDLNGQEIAYLGYAQTWNAEHGNSALGLTLGNHATLSRIAAGVGSILSLPSASPPAFVGYLGKVLSIDGMVGYMPAHSADAKGPIIYGVGATLDLTDVFALLSKGL